MARRWTSGRTLYARDWRVALYQMLCGRLPHLRGRWCRRCSEHRSGASSPAPRSLQPAALAGAPGSHGDPRRDGPRAASERFAPRRQAPGARRWRTRSALGRSPPPRSATSCRFLFEPRAGGGGPRVIGHPRSLPGALVPELAPGRAAPPGGAVRGGALGDDRRRRVPARAGRRPGSSWQPVGGAGAWSRSPAAGSGARRHPGAHPELRGRAAAPTPERGAARPRGRVDAVPGTTPLRITHLERRSAATSSA